MMRQVERWRSVQMEYGVLFILFQMAHKVLDGVEIWEKAARS